MKSVLICVSVVLLSGCYQSVNQYDISRAIRICGDVESVIEIHAIFNGDEHVLCKTGRAQSMSGL